MKISFEENPTVTETEISIVCKQADDKMLRLLAMLRVFDKKVTGSKNGEIFVLDAAKILYIDTVDKKTFFYTDTDVYETPLKLYMLEERLAGTDFLRASKSAVVNFAQIKSLRPDFGGRLEITMNNGEKLLVSRQYAAPFKEKLSL